MPESVCRVGSSAGGLAGGGFPHGAAELDHGLHDLGIALLCTFARHVDRLQSVKASCRPVHPTQRAATGPPCAADDCQPDAHPSIPGCSSDKGSEHSAPCSPPCSPGCDSVFGSLPSPWDLTPCGSSSATLWAVLRPRHIPTDSQGRTLLHYAVVGKVSCWQPLACWCIVSTSGHLSDSVGPGRALGGLQHLWHQHHRFVRGALPKAGSHRQPGVHAASPCG